MASIRSFDEELSLFDNAVCMVARVFMRRRVMASEQVFGKLVSGIPVAQESCVVETAAEFIHNRVRLVRCVDELRFHQGERGLNHGSIGECIGLRIAFVFEMQLRFKHQSFGIRQIELRDRNNFAGALPRSHVSDGEFPRITPIGIVGAVLFICRHSHERLQHGAAFLFADSLDEFLELFDVFAFADIAAGDVLDDCRDILRRHGTDRETV